MLNRRPALSALRKKGFLFNPSSRGNGRGQAGRSAPNWSGRGVNCLDVGGSTMPLCRQSTGRHQLLPPLKPDETFHAELSSCRRGRVVTCLTSSGERRNQKHETSDCEFLDDDRQHHDKRNKPRLVSRLASARRRWPPGGCLAFR